LDSINRWSMDEKAEKEGIWRDLGNKEKIRVRPSGEIGNEEQSTFIVEKCHESGSEVEQTPPDQLESIMIESLARFVLVGWEGFEKKGKKMEATLENKIMMLNKPAFRKRVLLESGKFSSFRASAEVKKVKN